MAIYRKLPPKVREYIKLLQNPYASLQVGDDLDDLDATEVSLERPPVNVEVSEGQQTELIFSESQKPSASLYEPDEPETPDLFAAAPSTPSNHKLSKENFRTGCRRIFRGYIPELEKGRLRQYHRDFIDRNENRPARIRYLLLGELTKYDLSNVQGIRPHFNRERTTLTEEKLRSIERLVVDE